MSGDLKEGLVIKGHHHNQSAAHDAIHHNISMWDIKRPQSDDVNALTQVVRIACQGFIMVVTNYATSASCPGMLVMLLLHSWRRLFSAYERCCPVRDRSSPAVLYSHRYFDRINTVIATCSILRKRAVNQYTRMIGYHLRVLSMYPMLIAH